MEGFCMRNPFEMADELRRWALSADEDLLNASHALKLGRRCPLKTVCYHAQQCVEMYLKSVLMLQRIRFPYTHDIELLAGLLPGNKRPPLHRALQRQITRYAVVTRYPGEYEPLTLAEAREAVKVARRVRSWCRKLLPPAALRKTGPKLK